MTANPNPDTQHFPKSKRLLNPADYQRVFDNPIKKIHSEHLLLFVQHGATAQARLGLAITKKKLKRAVMRNYLKRLSREYFRINAAKLAAVDVVLIVKKSHSKDDNLHLELSLIFDKLAKLYPACHDD